MGATLSAAPVTPAEALARLGQEGPAHLRGISSATATLAYTEMNGSNPSLYLFSKGAGKGFLLLPADDATSPLLGYSDSGTLPSDPALLPDGFRYWMAELSRQVAANAAIPASSRKQVVRMGEEQSYPPIAPLVKTKWNQGAPYNDQCPVINEERSVTGCVATALAQILKYHNYPAKGTGTHSYTWEYNYNGTSGSTDLSFDYGATEFDWDNMLDVYDSHATDAQKSAVATLMYACGVSVDMHYTPSESGASSGLVPGAMIDNFGYDKGCRSYYRNYYGIREWNDLVYNQLKDYGPVQYSGQSNDGGHSFVCDGYSSDGYFHINWGWGGMSDGYFLLTALDPGAQGIGGSTSGFDFDQDIVGNVSTKQTSEYMYEQILASENFVLSLDKPGATTPDVTNLSISLPTTLYVAGGYYNFSAGPISKITFGVKLIPEEAGDPSYCPGYYTEELEPYSGYRSYRITIPSSTKEGQYKVIPAFKDSHDVWQDIPVGVGKNTYYTMTVDSDKKATLTPQEKQSDKVSVTNLEQLTPIYIEQDFRFSATIENFASEEFLGEAVIAFISSAGKLVAHSEKSLIDLLPEESLGWTITSGFAATDPSFSAGEYKAVVAFMEGNNLSIISEPIDVTVHPRTQTEIRTSNFKVANMQPSDQFKATVDVECTAGYFFGTLKFVYNKPNADGRIPFSTDRSLTSPLIILQAPATRAESTEEAIPSKTTVEFSGALPDVEPGVRYYAILYGPTGWIQDPMPSFEVDLPTGVELVKNASPVVSEEYFSLTGVSYGSLPPANGLYIVRRIHEDGSVTTSRILRR